MRVDLIGRGIFGWVTLCSVFLVITMQTTIDNPFLQLGPNDDLFIFKIPIDTFPKYFIVIFYTACSTVVRTLQQEVITPWIIQNIQHDKTKSEFAQQIAYEITTIEVIYRWFDWFMYMNILLSQIDMMLVEILGNIVVSWVTTHFYIRPPPPSIRVPLLQ